jgi:regulator of cell morphogenesis and NO signaling
MTQAVTAEQTLDLRTRPAAAGIEEALARFDRLAPGERFVLAAGDSAAEVLQKMQSERPGAFEWSLLETGPAAWRIEVARHEGPARPLRGIFEVLSWDHARLDALERAAFRARESGDLQTAFDLYSQFAVGLRRHIGFEEDLLFPAFEAKTGLSAKAGPTAVMRAEHREIRDLLEQIDGAIGDAASSPEGLRARFHAVMSEHNEKEEGVLYPGADDLLGPEEADRLVRRIQGYAG